MKIAIGADHAGVEAKRRLVDQLQRDGHALADCGTQDTESVDYPDFAAAVAHAVAEGRAERGILICGTGIGMSIAANKVAGIRAAKCNDPLEASLSRRHNDANVLCVGARILDPTVMNDVARAFLATEFEGGRHARRVAMLVELEQQQPLGESPTCC